MAEEKGSGFGLGYQMGYRAGYGYGYEQAKLGKDKETIVEPKNMKFHFVQKNDTLSYLAEHFDTTVEELVKLNPHIPNADLIYEGDVIRVK